MKREPVIAVIGAGGFIGRALSHERALIESPSVRLFNRTPGASGGRQFEPLPQHPSAFEGVDAIVHLAGIAHDGADSVAYQEVNVELPVEMARLGRQAGVSVFVFVSSRSVNGNWREGAFAPDTPFAPAGPYGVSKVAAELSLAQELAGSRTHLSIIRPPPVYGLGSATKFDALVKAARLGAPLPLGCAKARRSMVSVRNLSAAILHLSRHRRENDTPSVLLPADDRDLTVTELYALLCGLMGRRVWQPAVPEGVMKALMRALGKQEMFDSLFRPAVVDRAHWAQLEWRPVRLVEDELKNLIEASLRRGC